MRLRFRLVSYAYTKGSQEHMQRLYHELWHELWHQNRQTRSQHSSEWRPPLDIHETPASILIKIEIAGMKEEHIEVTLYEDVLLVTGTREDDTPCDNDSVFCEAQVKYGAFRAEVPLRWEINREGIEANYENGFLRVTLPKKLGVLPDTPGVEQKQPRRQAGDSPSHYALSPSVAGDLDPVAPPRGGHYRA